MGRAGLADDRGAGGAVAPSRRRRPCGKVRYGYGSTINEQRAALDFSRGASSSKANAPCSERCPRDRFARASFPIGFRVRSPPCSRHFCSLEISDERARTPHKICRAKSDQRALLRSFLAGRLAPPLVGGARRSCNDLRFASLPSGAREACGSSVLRVGVRRNDAHFARTDRARPARSAEQSCDARTPDECDSSRFFDGRTRAGE
jgi:hypothetical protein